MKKYTNQLLIGLAVLFVGLMAWSNQLLKNELARYDFSDPYRHFVRFDTPPFRFAVLETGRVFKEEGKWRQHDWRAMNVEIQNGEQTRLYLHEEVKDSMQWRVSNDTLYVKGFHSTYNVRTAAAILSPFISGIDATTTAIEVKGIKADSLVLAARRHGEIHFLQFDIGRLEATLDQSSLSMNGKMNGRVRDLKVKRFSESEIHLDGVAPDVFEQPADTSSSVKLNGTALRLIKSSQK